MTTKLPADSIGIVTAQSHKFETPLQLDGGQVLPEFELAYETYGTLNAEHTNAIFICHALSGDHHAAGYYTPEDKYPGWWESCIGPGKPIDTNKFFVVCCNNIGGCGGSTGPTTINPVTGKIYGSEFPVVTVADWVRTQHELMQLLKIEKWAAVVGGSLGGMQALQWAIDYPEKLHGCVAIASAPNLTAQNIAFNEIARQAIMSDPDFFKGDYLTNETMPIRGLSMARMLGHITYLSNDGLGRKFGRSLRDGELKYGFDIEFEVESYLRYRGEKFARSFDANTYLRMTRALDYFNPAENHDGDLAAAFANTSAKYLVLSFTTDWRFSPERSREIVKALLDSNKSVTYGEIPSDHGHDAFLLPIPSYQEIFSAYMTRIAQEVQA